jgi:FkbM family methyltransferase
MKQLTLPNGEKIHYIDKLTAEYIYNEIYVENMYLQHGLRVNDGDVIFDVGANIGLFSRFIASQASGLEIFTFEPIPQIFQVLQANLSDVHANFHNYNVGLGREEKDVTFYYYPRVSGDSTPVPFDWDKKVQLYLKEYEDILCEDFPEARNVPNSQRKAFVESILKTMYKAKQIEGKIVPLSQIIIENNIETIDLLKIDAENYEWEVISGIEDKDWEKIQQVAIEIHQHIKGGETLLNDIKTFLTQKGFSTAVGEETRETKLDVYMLYGKR